jgi:hypothetical protein
MNGTDTQTVLSEPRSDNSEAGKSHCDPLSPTVFHEEWWLDAATDGQFDVAEVTSGGRTVGRLPFYVTKRTGISLLRMPPLTYFLGPAVVADAGTPNARFLRRLEVTKELLKRLPPASWQYVKCQKGVSDMIAFQESGFRTYVQFTHEIAPEPSDVLWKNMRDKTRNVIRRAEERFHSTEWGDPSEFVTFYERNLTSRGFKNEVEGRICRNIAQAAIERGRGRILAARDEKGRIVAANLCVWDQIASFYILSTRTEDSGNGAISLLLWESIKDSARRHLVFDFAGLGGSGSVLLYSGFGASIQARYVGVRSSAFARLLNELKLLFRRENCFY